MALTKVMVVDDSLTSRKFVIQSVRTISKELTILEADHGQQALNLLAEHPDVDIIISDDIMPYINGFDLASRMKSDARLATIPVVIMGSETSEKAVQRAKAAGATSYLPRPASCGKIVETVLAFSGSR